MVDVGTVVSIHIGTGTPGEGGSIKSVDEVRALAGKGLEGDRYLGVNAEKQVTLIQAEMVDALESESGVKLEYSDARRNIVTRGVALTELVGQEFNVGAISLRGVKLSEPCAHLASLTDERVLRGLAHKAGLNAVILNDGVIRVGDGVTRSETSAPHASAPSR